MTAVGMLMAEVRAALERINVVLDEQFTFRCVRIDGTVSIETNARRSSGFEPALQTVHGQLLIDLIDQGRCELVVTVEGRTVYRRRFSVSFVGVDLREAKATQTWIEAVNATNMMARQPVAGRIPSVPSKACAGCGTDMLEEDDTLTAEDLADVSYCSGCRHFLDVDD